ncbi:hypothetical protein [Reyranella soli]|uniref:hypothetical protein n=1 Tax=Reyranella soli TaxID=1230389 RepID=UPI00147893AE|nr:hypothetical protein [Reyranella soli]
MVRTAETKEVLRKRVQRLLRLDRDENDQNELRVRILPYLRSLGEVALIGGAIRDLARGGRKGFTSDLDFVVYGSSRENFREAMLNASGRPNRFGGFALPFRHWKVDVWHLEDTWARTAGIRQVQELRDLLSCTFFDWDSVIFDLRTGQLIFGQDYLARLNSGIMNVCLEDNPNPGGSLVRALRRAALWNVRFGVQLTEFSRRYLSELDWSDLVARDKRAFGEAVLFYLDKDDLMQRLAPLEMTDGILSTLPVPHWERQPRFAFSLCERTSLSPSPR